MLATLHFGAWNEHDSGGSEPGWKDGTGNVGGGAVGRIFILDLENLQKSSMLNF
jgi:hypothetical protein